MRIIVQTIVGLILTLAGWTLRCQTLPLGYPAVEDYVRRAQLLGKFDSTVSFSFRPLHINVLQDSALNIDEHLGKILKTNQPKRSELKLLPLQLNTEFNSHHPYGWNNGAMIRSRGLQTLLSGGISGKLEFISFQFKPELVFVENRDYEGFPDSHPDNIWRGRYLGTWNRVDLPERFGESPLTKLYPGQSSFRVNYRSFSVGVSSENLWWGPGRNHSLIMTNNASGFYHLSINTRKPAKTAIGTFESQFIIGRLDNSGFEPPSPTRGVQQNWLRDKKSEWRYLNGLTLTYNPKWVPGLFLGTSRVFQNYYDSTRIKKQYLPVFSNLFRENDPNPLNDGSLDQLFSFFLRWVMKEAQAELYAEIGRSDATWNLRDLLLSPDHSLAYLIGFSKLITLAQPDEFIEVFFETTHLELSKTGTLRAEPTWYTNGRARQGYTHNGEVLGAGIGPGSNTQYLSISWIKNLKKFGILLERVANDNDFYFRVFESEETARNWVDLGIGFTGSWNSDYLLLQGKIQYVRSRNYQWELNKNISNLYMTVNLSYLF